MRPIPRPLGLLLLCLAFANLGAQCNGGSPFAVLSPSHGSTVSDFDFTIEIELPPGADVSTLSVLLNGDDVSGRFSLGGAGATAGITPGPPLLDHNQIHASVDEGGVLLETNASFDYLPAKARVKRITDPSELLDGPLATGRLGDYRMENRLVALVIEDAPKRELKSIATFGGNLIDAVRKDTEGGPGSGPGAGLDHFMELQPMANLETVLNAQFVEIVNDGQDGTAAILRVRGPDDAFDYINLSSAVEGMGIPFPASADDVDQPVTGTTEYILEPETAALRLDTTWSADADATGDVPMYVGDLISGGGEFETWIPSFGVGDPLVTAGLPSAGASFPALFHTKVTFFGVREALGASYGLATIELPSSPLTTSSLGTSGVVATLHSHLVPLILQFGSPPFFVVPQDGSATYSRYFLVGGPGGGNLIGIASQLFGEETGTLSGCVTVGGSPAGAGARVVVDLDDGIQRVDVLYQTREDGCYQGSLPLGPYRVAGQQKGAPYESCPGSGESPCFHDVTLSAAAPDQVVDISLPQAAVLRVEVTDGSGSPSPARVTVVGADASPPLPTTHDAGLGSFSLGLFEDGGFVVNDPASSGDDEPYGKDALPFGVVATEFIGASGILEIPIEPGDYQVVISRGTEYSARFHDVSIAPGETEVVTTRIVRVIDSTGFVSGDFHVHLIQSTDSPVSRKNRVLSMAAEGIENIVVTEHHARTPLAGTIASLGLASLIHSTLGEEITTSDTGHYNAYPLDLVPDSSMGGTTDWGGAAPAGRDFATLGSFVLPPAAIHQLVLAENSSPNLAMQINHIGSHFGPLVLDTASVPPASHLSPERLLEIRLDPSSGNLFHPFDALELWNGSSAGAQNTFLNERIGIWMNLLNQGFSLTAIADTDTHTFHDLASAGARTWTASSSDHPGLIDDEQIGAAVHAGRAVGGQGIYVQTRLVAESTGQETGFGLADPTLPVRGGLVDPTNPGPAPSRQRPAVSTTNGSVHLDITVQAPLWAPFDTIEIYRNHTPVVSAGNSTTPPSSYGAGPAELTLRKDVDFAVVEVDPFDPTSIEGARRLQVVHRETLSGLTDDSWIVVVVKGSTAVAPMFPIFPQSLQSASNVDPATGVPLLAALTDGNLGEGGTRALGFTNALFVDVDGNGRIDPPWIAATP